MPSFRVRHAEHRLGLRRHRRCKYHHTSLRAFADAQSRQHAVNQASTVAASAQQTEVRTASTGSQGGRSPRTMLCTSITAVSVSEALKEMVVANSCGADMLELRLDYYKDFEQSQHLQQLMDACELPFIVTCRPEWEGCVFSSLFSRLSSPCPEWSRRTVRSSSSHALRGPTRPMDCACRGNWKGDESNRLSILHQAARKGATYIDVELDAVEAFRAQGPCPPEGPCQLILSHHNFERTLSREELVDVERRTREAGAHIAKIAMMANDICDAWTVLEVLRSRSGASLVT
jgi:3-dehydroquinate dehydratase / shikimate dehydrogenase